MISNHYIHNRIAQQVKSTKGVIHEAKKVSVLCVLLCLVQLIQEADQVNLYMRTQNQTHPTHGIFQKQENSISF